MLLLQITRRENHIEIVIIIIFSPYFSIDLFSLSIELQYVDLINFEPKFCFSLSSFLLFLSLILINISIDQ